MKWLALNEKTYQRNTRKVAVNPAMIIMVAPCRNGTEIYFMDEGMITVVETLEEVMALLGNECDWRMP